MGRVLTNNTAIAFAHEVDGSTTGALQSVFAGGRLDFGANPLNTEVVVIGSQTYQFLTSFVDAADNIEIGASAAVSMALLVEAINQGGGGPGGGTTIGTATVINADVTAIEGDGDSMTVTAKAAGTAPNSTATTTTVTSGVWDDTTLLGGAIPVWKLIEPNEVSAFGSEITTVAREPISKTRQRRAGTVTDLDSSVEVDMDWIMEHSADFLEGFLFSTFVGFHKSTAYNNLAATASGFSYTPEAGSALLANHLVFGRGFTLAANNGAKLVTAATDGSVSVAGTSVEAPAVTVGAQLDVHGIRGALGDFEIDANGDLITTALDMQTLGWTVGQFIHIGGTAAANQFFTAANTGRARIVTIGANIVTLDKKLTTFTVDDGTDTGSGGSNLQIDILYGRFLRNVSVDSSEFLTRQFQFEAAWDNLGDAEGTDAFEYAEGNQANEVAFNLPLTDKATMTAGFIGTDTDDPTEVRKSGGATATNPVMTEALNTSADIARLRVTQVDELGLTTDFKSMTITLNNNITPEKVLGQLGGKFVNTGLFFVDIETQVLFTEKDVPTAIRANTTVTMDFLVKNADGGMMVDIPSMKLGDGSKELPVNETVLINLTGQAFIDDTLQTSIGISLFPVLP